MTAESLGLALAIHLLADRLKMDGVDATRSGTSDVIQNLPFLKVAALKQPHGAVRSGEDRTTWLTLADADEAIPLLGPGTSPKVAPSDGVNLHLGRDSFAQSLKVGRWLVFQRQHCFANVID